MNLEGEILELLRREGPVTVYRIAKAFGITYGRAQWHIGRLQRIGQVYAVRIGSKRYVMLRDGNHGVLLQKVTVRDVLNEMINALSARSSRRRPSEKPWRCWRPKRPTWRRRSA